jgi:hypothetical protein
VSKKKRYATQLTYKGTVADDLQKSIIPQQVQEINQFNYVLAKAKWPMTFMIQFATHLRFRTVPFTI